MKHSKVDTPPLPHFADEESEVQRSYVNYSKLSSELVEEPRVHLPQELAFVVTLLPPREPLWVC